MGGIGDSVVERDALVEVTFCRTQPDRYGRERRCRCKVVKLNEDPDLLQLTAELEVLASWIYSLVAYDGDVDLDLSSTEDALAMLEKMRQAIECTDTVEPPSCVSVHTSL